MATKIAAWATLALAQLTFADIYFHNPRGSNNRLDEENRDRRNANRLFDSQNNARGGYNVGNLYYYGTSILEIEWTNQHSCGNPNANCELVLQYMCDDRLRDGGTIGTIPDKPENCYNNDCERDLRYGMNENYDHYVQCRMRQRNKGLFTADQEMRNRHRARHTRQNNNGNRRGYECPEERDYYPYWHPNPWIDIAVMTNNVERCDFYRRESQNVRATHSCVVPEWWLEQNPTKEIPNNEIDCAEFARKEELMEQVRWTMFDPHGVPPPECVRAAYSRDNHHGNSYGGFPNTYKWRVPNVDHKSCVLRMRYNISTNDYDSWNTYAEANADPTNREDGTKINLQPKYNSFANQDAARDAGYVFKNDPEVKIFPNADFRLQLAINTAQFGRTFEDRSHRFSIRQRPDDLPDEKPIYNLNVRGKRGNIVQNYPAVEYDFVPNDLEVDKDDIIHIQWTGSNSNNGANAGEGQRGSDRSNIVLLAPQTYAEGAGWEGPGGKFGHYGLNHPMHRVNTTLLGLDQDDVMDLAFSGSVSGDLSLLDDAGTYFDLGLRSVTGPSGVYQYMCTRNNNFSNRDQKGRITIATPPRRG